MVVGSWKTTFLLGFGNFSWAMTDFGEGYTNAELKKQKNKMCFWMFLGG